MRLCLKLGMMNEMHVIRARRVLNKGTQNDYEVESCLAETT